MARARGHTGPDLATIEDFLSARHGQDLLRFITCGSVDDGKSTLIGRLLWEGSHLFDDQRTTLAEDSRRQGTQGDDIDFALLVDGLVAEREQGITIDVAYRYFATRRRRFIVADTPGHEQYTRNMFTGASTAHLAVLLVDARKGLLVQTRRHACLVSLVGIREVVLAVNKMDLVGFDQARFDAIRADFERFAAPLGFEGITAIPVSALRGDNITARSSSTPWYDGPSLLAHLDTVPAAAPAGDRLVFPVQWVNRPHAGFRGYSGTVASGVVRPGDAVRVTASGECAQVESIETWDGPMPAAGPGDAVTLTLSREVDVSRGDVLSREDAPLQMTDQFEATLVWMHVDAGLIGRSYDLKLATQWAGASITSIRHRIDIDTLAHQASRQLGLNDISVCTLSTARPLVFDTYDRSRLLGSFILVDRFSNATVAAGMIRHGLRRAQNLRWQPLNITREDRERLNGHPGRVVWLTGLSGSGKSTLANALETALHALGRHTYILDGDNVRHGLNRDLGFTEADRVENIRRTAEVARLMMDAGLIVITAFISPFRRERALARSLVGEGRFLEVFVDTPLDVCEARDPKGLYRKARAGGLPNMTGIDSPYEAPVTPEFVAPGTRPVAELAAELCALLDRR